MSYDWLRWRLTGGPALAKIIFAAGMSVVAIGLIYAYLSASKSVQSLLTVLVGAILAYLSNYVLQTRRSAEERERELASRIMQAQDEALQTYLDQMGESLFDADNPVQGTVESNELVALARARTFALLPRLDERRKGVVVLFLSEAGLINRDNTLIVLGGTRRRKPRLVGVDMRDGRAPMPAGGLGENALTLGGANLEKIDLQGAALNGTDLSHVVLNYANFIGADLTEADLSGSLLVGADLTDADLSGAILDNATLLWANLYQAQIATAEVRRLANSGALIGAMMPDGSRPFPVPPEVEAEFRKHPESELAQRERELGRLARLLEQQVSPR